MKAVNQLVGAPVDSRVMLQCIVEAFPKPLNGWYRNEGLFLIFGCLFWGDFDWVIGVILKGF